MVDLGDLREGFWDKDELLEAALLTENELHNLKLAGIGTNLGCYGAVAATPEKLEELVERAEMIEEKIGRELEFILGRSYQYPSQDMGGQSAIKDKPAQDRRGHIVSRRSSGTVGL